MAMQSRTSARRSTAGYLPNVFGRAEEVDGIVDGAMDFEPGPSLGDKRGPDAAGLSGAQGPGRTKKARNVKTSFRKPGKAMTRRAQANVNGGPVPNEVCSTCKSGGELIMCDDCDSHFHFTCAEPPIQDFPSEEDKWYCTKCLAKVKTKGNPSGFFGKMLGKLDAQNPALFRLPPTIYETFKDVGDEGGVFVDQSKKRSKLPIERDFYKQKDKHGRAALCYRCGKGPSKTLHRRVIQCDECEVHWHIECVTPVMTEPPPNSIAWICPLHAEAEMPYRRHIRNPEAEPIVGPDEANNGNITVMPIQRPPRPPPLRFDRIQYQVPEETIILDFCNKLRAGPKEPETHSVSESLPVAEEQAPQDDDPGSGRSSPLTSVSSGSPDQRSRPATLPGPTLGDSSGFQFGESERDESETPTAASDYTGDPFSRLSALIEVATRHDELVRQNSKVASDAAVQKIAPSPSAEPKSNVFRNPNFNFHAFKAPTPAPRPQPPQMNGHAEHVASPLPDLAAMLEEHGAGGGPVVVSSPDDVASLLQVRRLLMKAGAFKDAEKGEMSVEALRIFNFLQQKNPPPPQTQL